MRKNVLFPLAIALTFLLFFSACKTHDTPDPAELLAGTYTGIRTTETFLAGQYTWDTLDPDTVSVTYAGEAGMLKINGTLLVLESGNRIDTTFDIHTWARAYFSNDSLSWTYSSGGLAGYQTSIFIGKR